MFLKKLSIHNSEDLIREIYFKKGINLIIDETQSEIKTDSGNGVGKTTVLRLIDFCLDGKGNNIFKDPEFKNSSNTKIEKFLKENNILITLVLVEDMNDGVNEITIQRNFLKRREKIQTINGEKYKNDDFGKKLKELIFKTKKDKPTFKQLKSKNIRDEKNKLVNTIKVLPPNVITDATYEALHLFWFGIDVDSSKDKLIREKKLEEKLQTRLRRESNLSEINQSLAIINNEIKELTRRKREFNIINNYEEDFEELNKCKIEISRLASKLSRLEVRRELILESKKDLEDNLTDINTSQVKRMYQKAKAYIPNIQRSFQDVLNFHNSMIHQKIKFITEELPSIEKEYTESKNKLSKLLKNEMKLKTKLNSIKSDEDLNYIIAKLNEFYERKGNFEEQKSMWESSNKKLEEINDQLMKINEGINLKDELIQNRISQFNLFFSDISSRLDGVYCLLSADNVDDVYKFKIGNIEGNPGTGSKKSQMASFDLAYIKFADKFNIPCLHFILQDQIENVHSNQITNLLTEIVNEVNCQYVLPVLRDKLPVDIDINKYEIISLSQDNKLFKV